MNTLYKNTQIHFTDLEQSLLDEISRLREMIRELEKKVQDLTSL